MRRYFFPLFLLLSACAQEVPDTRLSTPNGLSYVMHVQTAEERAEIGDILVAYMDYGTADSVIFDSHRYNRPVYLQVTNPAYKGSLEEGLQLLGAGDSATFYLVADSVYNRIFRQPLPPGIAPGTEMIFNIGVLAVRNEERDLEKYLINQNINERPRASGLIVQVLKEGKGPAAVPGKQVSVHYTGYLLDGTKFDSSRDRNEPFSFILGQEQVIRGWDEGVKLLKVGDQARLIIPSYLAYGPKGAGNGGIPPYSTLVFEVELVEAEQ